MSHIREPTANFSYMDGVPVKISEKYKPPRKVSLPIGFQHHLSYELLNEEHDFRLERSVLEKMGEWRILRKAAADSRKERIKLEDEAYQEKLNEDLQNFSMKSTGGKLPPTGAENSGSCSDSRVSSTVSTSLSYPEPIVGSVLYTNASLNPTTNESFSNLETQPSQPNTSSVSSTPSNQNVQFSHRTSILTPVPFSQNSSNANSTKSSSQFNFSDFEADTSSPFDNMELKTINEMEELAHVLQPVSNSPDSKECSGRSDVDIGSNFPTTAPTYSINQVNTHFNTIGAKPNKDSMIFPHINGLTGYGSYGTAPRTKERDTRSENYVNAGHNLYNTTSSVPIEMGNIFSFYHQPWNMNVNISHPSAYHSVENTEIQANVSANVSTVGNCLSGGGVTLTDQNNRSGLNSVVSFPSTYNQRSSNDDSQTSGKSLSKSVPDIVQELEKELAEKRVVENNAASGRVSHTPPPRPNSFGSTGLEDWKPWPDLDSPDLTQSKNKKSPAKVTRKKDDSSLPNPFHELSGSSQKLAKHISEMGFDLPRVARACQMFGEDDKKVVEFLLQVQSLEEKSWPGDLAEKAVVANENDVSEALKFLEAFTQLLDLGFPEDKVTEALVRFHNDRDKALDHLIS